MASSFFFLQAEENDINHPFINQVESYADIEKKQAYIIDRPLGDSRYIYDYKHALVLLIPKYKIIFLNFGEPSVEFDDFVEDFLEDIGFISDKYHYKNVIGRPRVWREELVCVSQYSNELNLEDYLSTNYLDSIEQQKNCELIISLLTGSINDVDRVKKGIPDTILDKVKQKILLFDGDQTRFVYQNISKPTVRIQGLSGTGKTELLLHKLKEIYLNSDNSKIIFTCHNKILADNLKKRIPDFFNFMKVEQQIKWSERLWCVHAWGSQNDSNSGAYRYICDYYDLPFYTYSRSMSFDRACTLALEQLKSQQIDSYAFDFMLIDESQDFPTSFFELCSLITRQTVYIAGDIFQSIFDENIITSVDPDFLLSKCYRTDPRTLMFAHSLGMGLFEPRKLRWLEDEEWKACGYLVDKDASGANYQLKREPLRRFEDLESENIESIALVKTSAENTEQHIIDIINDIRTNNPTVVPDDIGIIFIDSSNRSYLLADRLEYSIPRAISWPVNKAYESKRKIADTIFLSNKNNVKGLEFPFVICIAECISRSYSYRNALYMMLTRSFIKTYLLLSDETDSVLLGQITDGLKSINDRGFIQVTAPSGPEKEQIKTTIKQQNIKKTYYEIATSILDELKVKQSYRKKLLETTRVIVGDNFDYLNVKEVIQFTYKRMLGE